MSDNRHDSQNRFPGFPSVRPPAVQAPPLPPIPGISASRRRENAAAAASLAGCDTKNSSDPFFRRLSGGGRTLPAIRESARNGRLLRREFPTDQQGRLVLGA